MTMKRRRKYQTLKWLRPNDETITMRAPIAVAWTCARAIAQQVGGCHDHGWRGDLRGPHIASAQGFGDERQSGRIRSRSVQHAEANKIRWYEEARRSGRSTTKAFRTVIPRDHIECNIRHSG